MDNSVRLTRMNRFQKLGSKWRWFAWVGLAIVTIVATFPRNDWVLLRARLINSQAVSRMGLGGYLVFDTVDTAQRIWRRSQLADVDATPFREFLIEHARQARNPIRSPG
mgnify:CR=1 FL=1